MAHLRMLTLFYCFFPDEEELIFNLEDHHHTDLSSSMSNLSPNAHSGGIKHQTSLPTNKYRNKAATTPINPKLKLPRQVSENPFLLFLPYLRILIV